MEASEAFTGPAGTEIADGDDPFAGGEDWKGFEDPAPEAAPAEPAPATAEMPVVDKEGQPVEVAASAPSDGRTELERQEDAYQYKTQRGEPVTEALMAAHAQYNAERAAANEAATQAAKTEAAAPEPEPVAEPMEQQAKLREIAEREAAEAAKAAAEPAPEASVPAEAVPEAPAPVAESEPPAAEPEAAAPAPSVPEDPPAAEVSSPPSATEGGESEDAPPPEEPKNEKGKTTHRRYYVMKVTDTGKYERVAWYEDKAGKMVAKGTAGAKRQTVALSRGTEDALKIGYIAVGSPVDGATLVAVAALHFQERRVRPKAPEPSKARLEIS